MKFIIIDIQGYLSPPRFIPKEVAITDGLKSENILVKSIRPNLTASEVRQKMYLENNHHGLTLSAGYTDLDDCINILKRHVANSDIVYVRGHQREFFFEKYSR